MEKLPTTISTTEAAARLNDAGLPVTANSIRRWCSEGFGIRFMGRWRIPADKIAELEGKLRRAANDQVPTCRSSSM
jgi:hypothetical protein